MTAPKRKRKILKITSFQFPPFLLQSPDPTPVGLTMFSENGPAFSVALAMAAEALLHSI